MPAHREVLRQIVAAELTRTQGKPPMITKYVRAVWLFSDGTTLPYFVDENALRNHPHSTYLHARSILETERLMLRLRGHRPA